MTEAPTIHARRGGLHCGARPHTLLIVTAHPVNRITRQERNPMTMTDPLEGTATYRAQIARMALAEFEDYTHDRGQYADRSRTLRPEATGGLANAAAWLLEMLAQQDAAS